jgi:anoctamin-10/anoctamin-7
VFDPTPPGLPRARPRRLQAFLQKRRKLGGCGINLEKEKERKALLDYFPLHEEAAVEHIAAHILPWGVMPYKLPIDDLRHYYGEKIALYFSFLAHYTHWLFIPSVLGLGL